MENNHKERYVTNFFILITSTSLSITALANNEVAFSFPPAQSTLTQVDAGDWQSVIDEFESNAIYNHSTTRIQSCERLYSLPVTTSREGNVSWGGICTLAESGQRAFICTDRMLGRFEVFQEFQRDLSWIAQKIFDNCWGG